MFESILKHGRELFFNQGFASVSTNQIAEAAGISVGSLYQYFGSCESIALAVYKSASVRATELMSQKAQTISDLPISEALEELISCIYEIFRRDQYVLLQLIDEVPDLREPARSVSFERLVHKIAKSFLRAYNPDTSESEFDKKVYLLETLVIGTIRRFLEDRPENFTSEELIAELVSICQFHLRDA
jgi:AcrR family transcriptional regulator